MSEIIEVVARQILDSRGNPTIEVDVTTTSGLLGRAAVPSGASTGAHEAHELRDEDKSIYGGKGVLRAVAHVNEKIGPELQGMDVTQQVMIDNVLRQVDGSENKSNLGANALLGVSLACAKAGALVANLPLYQYVGGTGAYRLPVPLMNVLNGGAHSDNGLDVQEFMLVPIIGNSYSESLRAGCETFHTLKKILKTKKLATGVGDEGGFAPVLENNEHALKLLSEAVEKAGYKLGENMFFALDVDSTELFDKGQYRWEGSRISGDQLGDIYTSWKEKYPILSIEDAFAEDDWQTLKSYTQKMGTKMQLVGDDLFVTNPKRIQMGIDQGAANALLVKVNQIGTLSETWDAVHLAQRHRYKTIMSHRSGETEDTTIADLAVGMGCHQIKTGSLSRGERTAKYNQLLRIEEELDSTAQYWGKDAFK